MREQHLDRIELADPLDPRRHLDLLVGAFVAEPCAKCARAKSVAPFTAWPASTTRPCLVSTTSD